MANLPTFQTDDLVLSLMQNRWGSILNPVIACPMAKVQILADIPLITGANTINHKLGRKPQGWFLTDRDGSASVFRSAAFTDLTLQLTASAPVTVSIGVF